MAYLSHNNYYLDGEQQMEMHSWYSTLTAATILLACTSLSNAADNALDKTDEAKTNTVTNIDKDPLPEPMREFRGVWVASVANIDWPSKRGLSTEQQQKELIDIMDKCKELNMNAVLFHIRPAADAMYKSDLEPWSPFLTGEMGKAPEPFYDPLEMAVTEAHKRGMELHTWFNPYRALLNPDKEKVSDNHISKTKPNIVKRYGEYLWMDPGEKETQEHSLAVILDVVKRYNIDGIHIDDYFYPYKIKDKKTDKIVDFPDEESYKKYQDMGGKLDRGDWRRDNVNQFIERFYADTKKIKPWVKVGISPFGMWRPGYPKQIKGFDQYEELYADARLWLRKGWVDYFTPQLYWNIANPDTSFVALLQWWCGESAETSKRPIWPGLYTGRITNEPKGDGKAYCSKEIEYQIKWCRLTPNATGQVHFSMKTFFRSPNNLNDVLTTTTAKAPGVYSQTAVVPAMPWLDKDAPLKPQLKAEEKDNAIASIQWEPANEQDKEDMRFWFVQWREDGKWKQDILPATETAMKFTPEQKVDRAAVRAIDRASNMSEPADTTKK